MIARGVFALVCVLALAAVVVSWSFHRRVKASLPQLDGEAPITGLSGDVTVTRDALGVPSIRATARPDAARALGFLHAQDRFFQMDIARRRAAGELSELFGEKTLDADKAVRVHGLRAVAQKSLAQLPGSQRELLDAYAAGVNAGLAQLGERPFEYLLLRAEPRAWLPEDCVLVIHAMALDLQHPDASSYERMLGVIRECYDVNVLAYFAPLMAPNDSPLDGSAAQTLAPIPRASSINLRANASAATRSAPSRPAPPVFAAGSNSMAFAGMIENDMHLALRVPNTWYRVSMTWNIGGTGSVPSVNVGNRSHSNPDDTEVVPPSRNTVTGITHPGAPVVIAGSNGRIAWGFANAFADTSDIVVLTPDRAGPEYYYANNEIAATTRRIELIRVRGKKKPVELEVESSVWGPVTGENMKGQKTALKWVFHDPAAANYDLVELETAQDISEAVRIANRAGIPAQNMLVTDTSGGMAWTICGRLPDRFGYDGRAPATWSFGDRGWRGLLPPEKTPAFVSGPSKNLSTANQRLFGGDTLALLGDGGYFSGERGARIQTLLARLDQDAAPRDLLAVVLDTSAPHLGRWHKLLRDTLAPSKNKKLTALRAAAGETWDGRASADSAPYAIVSRFREHVIARVLAPVFEPCADVYPEFNYNRLRVEAPVWNLVQQKPAHLLAPEYASWDDLLSAAAADTRRDLAVAGFSNPAKARWGAFNVSRIRHPLSDAFMGVPGRLLDLDMPAHQLPGDDGVPRVQGSSHGASMRFVVAPGKERDGIFHMPGGQSGHPLSPYYRAGHEAWVRGDPTPFLPGDPDHTLVLKATK